MSLKKLITVLDRIQWCTDYLGSMTRNQIGNSMTSMSRASFYRYAKFALDTNLANLVEQENGDCVIELTEVGRMAIERFMFKEVKDVK